MAENDFRKEENFTGDYDTFSAGVEPGGLRNTSQIKILISFLVKNIKNPLTGEMITGVISSSGLANYFDSAQALKELVDTGSLEKDKSGVLTLTRVGMAAANELEGTLPRSVREKAICDMLHSITVERRKAENSIEVTELENGGANVTFTVTNGTDTLMKLTVYAADRHQVEKIKSNYLRDPIHVYAGIVTSLFS